MLTDDDLATMLRDCGPGPASTHYEGCHLSHPRCAVMRLVAALRAERERCAKVVESLEPIDFDHEPYGAGYVRAQEDAAAAIRRGEG